MRHFLGLVFLFVFNGCSDDTMKVEDSTNDAGQPESQATITILSGSYWWFHGCETYWTATLGFDLIASDSSIQNVEILRASYEGWRSVNGGMSLSNENADVLPILPGELARLSFKIEGDGRRDECSQLENENRTGKLSIELMIDGSPYQVAGTFYVSCGWDEQPPEGC